MSGPNPNNEKKNNQQGGIAKKVDLLLKNVMRPLVNPSPHFSSKIEAGKNGNWSLSGEAVELIEKAYEGLEDSILVDIHLHLIGTQQSINGNYIHPSFLSWKNPVQKMMGLVYEEAFGIKDRENAEREAIQEILIHSKKMMKGEWRFGLLAMDQFHTEDGRADREHTKIHLTNSFVFQLASQYQDLFIPIISVHPYRRDALKELEHWANQGAKVIKWLPNVMGIDPSHPQCVPFFDKMKELNMYLLSHIGHESAIKSSKHQNLGNPLLLRSALERGVKVIMAHCGTLGKSMDLDHGGKKKVDNFELFMRLMEDPSYKENLYGDLAAITQTNRMKYLKKILEAAQEGSPLHGRLINGSDYPLPAINLLVSTRILHLQGLITAQQIGPLNEIYSQNPLLFDFVLKRSLTHPQMKVKLPLDAFRLNGPQEGVNAGMASNKNWHTFSLHS